MAHTLHALEAHWIAVMVAIGLWIGAATAWAVVKMHRHERFWDRWLRTEAPPR